MNSFSEVFLKGEFLCNNYSDKLTLHFLQPWKRRAKDLFAFKQSFGLLELPVLRKILDVLENNNGFIIIWYGQCSCFSYITLLENIFLRFVFGRSKSYYFGLI